MSPSVLGDNDKPSGEEKLSKSNLLQARVVEYQRTQSPELYTLIVATCRRIFHRMVHAAHPKFRDTITIEDLLYESVDQTIPEVLKYYKSDGGAKFSTYLSTAVYRSLNGLYAKCIKIKRDIRIQISLQTPSDENGSPLIDVIPSPETGEEFIIQRDMQFRITAIVDLLTSTCLVPRQRECMRHFQAGATPTEISAIMLHHETGKPTAPQNSSGILARARRRIHSRTKQLGIEQLEDLIRPEEVLFRLTFPELEYNDRNLSTLANSGFILDECSPYVSINSEDHEKFNIAMFELKEGGYISGYSILSNHKIDSVSGLFRGDEFDEEKFNIPAPASDQLESPRKLSKPEMISLMRRKENIDEMFRIFAVYFTEDGKWHFTTKKQAFLSPWIKMPNGRLLSGYLVLKEFGLPRTDEGREKVFSEVFGEDQTEYLISRAQFNTLEILGRERYLQELRSYTNRRRLRSAGIEITEDKCHVRMSMRDHREMSLRVNKTERNLEYILNDFGLNLEIDDVLKLLKIMFPEKCVLLWIHKNGTPVDLPDEEETLNELQLECNISELKKYLYRWSNNRYTVDLRIKETCTGTPFVLRGGNVGIRKILSSFDLPYNSEGVFELYQLVFGKEQILEHPPVEGILNMLRRGRNSRILLEQCKVTVTGRTEYTGGDPDSAFPGTELTLGGSKRSIRWVLKKIGLTRNIANTQILIDLVFNEHETAQEAAE